MVPVVGARGARLDDSGILLNTGIRQIPERLRKIILRLDAEDLASFLCPNLGTILTENGGTIHGSIAGVDLPRENVSKSA